LKLVLVILWGEKKLQIIKINYHFASKYSLLMCWEIERFSLHPHLWSIHANVCNAGWRQTSFVTDTREKIFFFLLSDCEWYNFKIIYRPNKLSASALSGLLIKMKLIWWPYQMMAWPPLDCHLSLWLRVPSTWQEEICPCQRLINATSVTCEKWLCLKIIYKDNFTVIPAVLGPHKAKWWVHIVKTPLYHLSFV